jgi:hypothetical protein
MEKKSCMTQVFITALVIKDWHCRLASQKKYKMRSILKKKYSQRKERTSLQKRMPDSREINHSRYSPNWLHSPNTASNSSWKGNALFIVVASRECNTWDLPYPCELEITTPQIYHIAPTAVIGLYIFTSQQSSFLVWFPSRSSMNTRSWERI